MSGKSKKKPGARPALTAGARVHLLNGDGSVYSKVTCSGSNEWLVERMYVQRGAVLADIRLGPASKPGVRLNRLRVAPLALGNTDA